MNLARLRPLAAACAIALPTLAASTFASLAQTAPVTQAEIDAAMSTPTTIEFWTWMPNAETYVANFEKAYPAIKVNLTNVGQGADEYTKLRTAIQAGEGPDVVGIEYPFLSGFQRNLLDLRPYLGEDISALFVQSAWNQVVAGEAVIGVPQDFGPFGVVWRSDVLEKAGVAIPTTWEEFAAAAPIIKEKTGSTITTMGSSFGPWFVALLWQAGVTPFGYDGDATVTIDLTSEKALAVANYWNDLIQKDLVDVAPQFTNEWFTGLTEGKYASWLTAAWGPVFLEGSAASSAGKWTASALPQYDVAKPASAYWGGMANTVLSTSKNPLVATQFAKFWSTDKDNSLALAANFAFVPLLSTQQSPEFIEAESSFFNGQKVHKLFGEIAETVTTDFQWLPFNDYAMSAYNETVGAAMANKTDLASAMQAWQDKLVAYGAEQGFTVNP
jgi:multiple sugar transport system substrate-binding protein